ncbi:MAG: tRNA 2-thiouridine(34) synthase MnmA [Patescibacteria group bacterium]
MSAIKNSIFGNKKRETVALGLSGGVDSAVSALLLKEAGYDVTGVFIRTWHPEGYPCSEGEDRTEAVRVAVHLGIPFEEMDLSEEYKREVADKMLAVYASGGTPNPDILCNREIKFGAFAREMLKRFDFIATGHYASLAVSPSGKTLIKESEDKDKDQTYFLASIPENILSRVIFPVGNLQKSQVREMALKFDLPNANRKDSQGICFLGKIDLKKYLEEKLKPEQGEISDISGEIIGKHKGVGLYTLGERRGLQITSKGPNSKPLYVVKKDIETNTIFVADHEAKDNYGYREVLLYPFNNFAGTEELVGQAKIRHRGLKIACQIDIKETGIRVHFDSPVLVAPGQWLAIYKDRFLMAGGEVQRGL